MKKLFVTMLVVGAAITLFAQKGAAPVWESPLRQHLETMADNLTKTLQPWSVPDKNFKVEEYGAVADGKTVNTAAIQKAIDACSAAGGGVVLFSNGNYVTGTIVLKSGVMLEVAAGSKILGSLNLADYPEKVEAFQSVMNLNHKYRLSLIYAEKAERVGIRGKGEIYFRGERENFPGPETSGAIEGRPFGIRMIECKNVVLQDIFLHNAAAWMQNYLVCENLIFDGIRVQNHANFNNDGLDPDGCRNVIVRNCFINAEDDAMCFKGASNRLTENVLIENSVFLTTCNPLKIGTDTQGSFRNIYARNLKLGGIPDYLPTFDNNHQASTGISLGTVDGGNIDNVLIANVWIYQARCPVFLRVADRGRVMPGVAKPKPGTLKHIVIENVAGEDNFGQGSFISGVPGYPVEDIVIRNFDITMAGDGTEAMAKAQVVEDPAGYPDAHQFSVKGLPSYGFYLRHARNINFYNVTVTSKREDARPLYSSGGDVEHVKTDGQTTPMQ